MGSFFGAIVISWDDHIWDFQYSLEFIMHNNTFWVLRLAFTTTYLSRKTYAIND
jgi:hypothetical protein